MEEICIERHDGIARVSLNRPSVRNAVTLAMWNELAGIFSGFAADRDVRGVVLIGTGNDFSVGADISEFERIREDRHQAAAYEVAVDACSSAIAALSKPVVAAISGYCLGGGCHLALACDFRFGDRSARIGIPAARLSIVYGVNSVQRLLALTGLSNAKRILFSADRYGVEQAVSMGLIDEVHDNVAAAADKFLRHLATNAPLSIGGAKYMLNGLSMGSGVLDLAMAQRLIDEASDSEDFREGRRAFVEKRPPRFRGE
ncbi:enoyl-CoA hydratase/isomerase family protein [Bradyrhizobium tropiciagri]|uniref:enoyl-CoA hydratase-related protein n=1 Tax=Bradyrhizobium tropiciagri TaxID=312253 RepID=UPI001BA5E035|nr:enoyl-CoA hydratase-related protein [Bradyrhizobium tropiciagri]MBR0870661.1 enoyl-CoA hydratase/isomerase family protein [Bradyrhizobium tropiciagri]